MTDAIHFSALRELKDKCMKSRTWICTTAFCLFVALSIPPRSAALNDPNHQPTIITFDVSGAGTGVNQGTFPVAINPKGAITGTYVDSNNVSHGFLRAPDGTVTTFDPTDDVNGIFVAGINPAGAITGSYFDSNLLFHGFLRAADGTITVIDAPGAGSGAGTFQGTTIVGINAAGAIVGSYLDANNINHGFLRACGHENECDKGEATFTTFDVPGAGTGAFQGTTVFGVGFFGGNFLTGGINPAGAITGSYLDSNFLFHAFLRATDGAITPFDVPGASTIEGAVVTDATAINPNGTIAGFYFQPIPVGNPFGGNFRGFARDRDGTFTTFDAATYPPCCIWTFAEAINPEGVIAGYDNDGHDINHGFVRTRNGTIITFDAPGAGTGNFQGTIPFSINPSGEITGYFTDARRVAHGFLREKD
jgi:hypothetical protein